MRRHLPNSLSCITCNRITNIFYWIPINHNSHTDGYVCLQEVVDGTLLVTPNAVMFDPNVSDPLVVEHGIDEYGVVVKMDSIVAAAIYRDIQAMEYMQHNG